MSSLNQVNIIGRLGADPEIKGQDGGIANMRIATDESYKDKSGQKVERTEWHTVVMFGRLAEIAGDYLRKGSLVYVCGRLRTRKWQDKQGHDRYSTEIVADRMQMLGGKTGGEQQREARPAVPRQARPAAESPPPAGASAADPFDDDIPF